MTLQVGDTAPDFDLDSTSGRVRLSNLRGKRVVLAFYQEDATPSCTTEVSALRDEHTTLANLGASVIAVSADDLDSHRRFLQQLGDVPFPLASDTTLEVARSYDVIDDTGRRTRRAVFVIDEQGRIAHAIPWYNPSNAQHYEEIFRALGMEF